MNQNNPFFDEIEKRTNVRKDDIFNLANSVASANFQDEKTVRQLVSDVSRLAGVPVSKQKEDQIVKAVVNNKVPMSLSSLTKMFKQK